jgi:hypothetical protein
MTMDDPMEEIIAQALIAAREPYVTGEGGGNPSGLDFCLTDHDIEIEVKRFHSERIAGQMSRADDVIAIQGEKAIRYFADLLRRANP